MPIATSASMSRTMHEGDARGQRAERHANGDLARAARDGIGHHAVEADHRQQRREHAQHRREAGHEPFVDQRATGPAPRSCARRKPAAPDRSGGRPRACSRPLTPAALRVRTYMTSPRMDGASRIRKVHLWLRIGPQAGVVRRRHDADDLDRRRRARVAAAPMRTPSGIAAVEKPRDELFVDDRHSRRRRRRRPGRPGARRGRRSRGPRRAGCPSRRSIPG